MKVKKIPTEEYEIAKNLYCQSFFKQKKDITIPLLGEILGLYKENELIGMAQIDYLNNLFENKKQAIINSFCIKENYRHQGYGHHFLNECLKYLKEQNIDEITVTSNKNRIYAHMLYKKNNFEIIDTNLLKKNLL